MSILIPSSLGDILAVSSLVFTIYNTLRNSQGSTLEYQYLIDELFSLHKLLKSVSEALSGPGPSNLTVSHATSQDIGREVATCQAMMKMIDNRIKKHEEKLGVQTQTSSGLLGLLNFRQARNAAVTKWHKFGWQLFTVPEIEVYRAQLKRHQEIIVHFLSVIATSQNSNIQAQVQRVATEVTQIHSKLHQIPFTPRYGRQHLVIVENAFGKEMPLLIDLCYTAEALHRTLLHYWEKMSGFDFVNNGEYTISTNDGVLIPKDDPTKWQIYVKKGSYLIMSMAVEKSPVRNVRPQATCPRCGETELGLMVDGEWRECRRCTRRIQLQRKKVSSMEDSRTDRRDIADFRNICIISPSLSGRRRSASFVCTYNNCDAEFTRKHDLRKHLEIHGSTAKTACTICGKVIYRSSLRRHEKICIG